MKELVIPQDNIVSLTDNAIAHFDSVAAGKFVKLGLDGGKCAGFQYTWALLDSEEELLDMDETFKYNNFTFVVDGYSIGFLLGSTVDVVEEFVGKHITINNPNAASSCGCGESVNFG